MIARVLVAALAASLLAPATAAASERADASWTGPLHTEGSRIVDADGNDFQLKSGNWHGASGTWNGSGDVDDPANHHDGEHSHGIPLGLDRASMDDIVGSFHELGINSIRLPFSNDMIDDEATVPDEAVAANPELRGKTRLEIYDAAVRALTGSGLAVILNNHTGTSRWCCGVDGNERWNSGQSDQEWEDDWAFMAARYADDERVVGADLYNEVRRDVFDDPNWGLGDEHDWFAASQRAGDRILDEANPNLLIIIEGINWTGLPVDGLPHERPTLEPVRALPQQLAKPDKLVYSAHFYGYTGPNHSGATGTGETHDPRYQDMSREELYDVLRRQAFFVTEDGQPYTAPLWISEFGVGRGEQDPKAREWFENFTDFLVAEHANFAYWPLVGWQEGGESDGWGLVQWDSAGDRISVDDGDWRADAWHRLIDG